MLTGHMLYTDLMLGTRIEAWWLMALALRQVCLRCDRCARSSMFTVCLPTTVETDDWSGARAHLTTTTMVERFILRQYTRHGQIPLHLPLITYAPAEVLDTRRIHLPDVQPSLLLVRSRKRIVRSSGTHIDPR